MFKSSRWRGVAGGGEKGKAKVVFKLHFHATGVGVEGGGMMVVLTPADAARPTARTEKSAAANGGGSCRWPTPVYETVKFARDAKSGRFLDKIYNLLLYETGSSKAALIGEASLNMAEYADAVKQCAVALQLRGSDGVLLHVTIQRMVGGSADGIGSFKEDGSNGDDATTTSPVKPQRRTLLSQLSSCNDDEVAAVTNGITHEQDQSVIKLKLPMKFPSSRDMPLSIESSCQLQRSSSLDAISASGSDGSSERFTLKENCGTPNSLVPDSMSLLSPLSVIGTPKNALASSVDWSGSSAPDGSTDGSTSNSGEGILHGQVQDSDDSIEKLRSDMAALTRKFDVSELELKTLRKQIVKESKRVQELTKEVTGLKEERDMLQRQCVELSAMQKATDVENKMLPNGEDPWTLINELKEELTHEKNLNVDLRMQLQKTQESNTELLLAVKELDEMLELKQKTTSCSEEQPRLNFHETEYGNALSDLANSGHKAERSETCSDENQEELSMAIIVRNDSLKMVSAESKSITELSAELQLYKKEREEIEMQMEQLALDYEILTQENHDISSRLEQAQVRETLRIGYECSAHLATISELETQAEGLEKELQYQAEEFEAELAAKINEKVELEKRAIKAEDLLRKARWNNANAAERLQEEFKTLSSQMSFVFKSNERLLIQARKEANELHLQKSQLEEIVKKTRDEYESLQAEHRIKMKQLLGLLDLKSKEIDRLLCQLKKKSEEFHNAKLSDDLKLKALMEEINRLKANVEELEGEKISFTEPIAEKDMVLVDSKYCVTSNDKIEANMQDNGLVEKEAPSNVEESSTSLREPTDIVEVQHRGFAGFNESNVATVRDSGNIKSCMNTAGTNEEKPSISPEGAPRMENGGGGITTTASSEGSSCHCEDTNYKDNTSMGDNLNSIGDQSCRRCCSIDGRSSGAASGLPSTSDRSQQTGGVLEEMTSLKQQNEMMQEELKDLQDRYSEISLRFAEVEGERQQLVMTVRSLKNAMK